MPIKLYCPHCRRGWSVPRKHAGTKMPCPACQGDMDVQTLTATTGAATTELVGTTGPVPAEAVAADAAPPTSALATDLAGPGAAKPKANRPPSQSSKVAKFIAAGADRPAVEIATDGRLPELKLAETAEKIRSQEKVAGSNPLLLVFVMLISLGLSVLMLFTDFEQGTSGSDRKREARAKIEKEFFGDESKPLAPYQVLLREAQQAHSRGDRRAEREVYQRVVELLRAERRIGFTSVTGKELDDKKLEDLISELLADE